MSLIKRYSSFEYTVIVLDSKERVKEVLERTKLDDLYVLMSDFCYDFYVSVTAGYESNKHRCYHLRLHDSELDELIATIKEETKIPVEKSLIIRLFRNKNRYPYHDDPSQPKGTEYDRITAEQAKFYLSILHENILECEKKTYEYEEYEVKLNKSSLKDRSILCLM